MMDLLQRTFFPADRIGPIKRKRPGAQIAPGHTMGKQALWGIIGGMFCTPCLFSLLYHELKGHTGRRKERFPFRDTGRRL